MNDIYVRFKAYKTVLAEARILSRQPLYMAAVDVKNAFDSIPHDKLLAVVTDVLSEVSAHPDPSGRVRKYGER